MGFIGDRRGTRQLVRDRSQIARGDTVHDKDLHPIRAALKFAPSAPAKVRPRSAPFVSQRLPSIPYAARDSSLPPFHSLLFPTSASPFEGVSSGILPAATNHHHAVSGPDPPQPCSQQLLIRLEVNPFRLSGILGCTGVETPFGVA